MSEFSYHQVTIASGQTASSILKEIGIGPCSALVGIIMPSAWTAADITFQCAHDQPVNDGDPTAFQDVYDKDGIQLKISSPAANRFIMLIPSVFAGFRHLKLISSAAQGAARTLTVVVREV